jgi:plastocyanin
VTSQSTQAASASPAAAGGDLVAVLRSIGPTRVLASQPVRLDASGSRDQLGRIRLYRWDWDGRGLFTTQTVVPQVTHVFRRPGIVLVGVEVVDDHGRVARADLRLTVVEPGRRRGNHVMAPPLRSATPAAGPARAAAGSTVTIKDFSFGPAGITVRVGDSVTWANQGPSSHTATATGSFDTGVLKKGQSASYTFTHAGTFSYFCSIHPFMKATVTVLAATNSSGSPTSGSPGSNSGAAPSGASESHESTSPSSGGATETSSTKPPSALPNTGANLLARGAAGLVLLMLGATLLYRIRRGQPRR